MQLLRRRLHTQLQSHTSEGETQSYGVRAPEAEGSGTRRSMAGSLCIRSFNNPQVQTDLPHFLSRGETTFSPTLASPTGTRKWRRARILRSADLLWRNGLRSHVFIKKPLDTGKHAYLLPCSAGSRL